VSREQPPALRECASCGGQWFRLCDEALPEGMGALLVNEEGNIAGYAGSFVCVKCGEQLDRVPFASGEGDRLRLVQ